MTNLTFKPIHLLNMFLRIIWGQRADPGREPKTEEELNNAATKRISKHKCLAFVTISFLEKSKSQSKLYLNINTV